MMGRVRPRDGGKTAKTRTASTPAQGVTRFREKRPIATTASAPAFAALPAGASGREPFAPRFAATADVRFGRDRGFSGGRSLPPLRPARILIPNGPARVSDAVGIVPCRADEHDSAAGTRALEGVHVTSAPARLVSFLFCPTAPARGLASFRQTRGNFNQIY